MKKKIVKYLIISLILSFCFIGMNEVKAKKKTKTCEIIYDEAGINFGVTVTAKISEGDSYGTNKKVALTMKYEGEIAGLVFFALPAEMFKDKDEKLRCPNDDEFSIIGGFEKFSYYGCKIKKGVLDPETCKDEESKAVFRSAKLVNENLKTVYKTKVKEKNEKKFKGSVDKEVQRLADTSSIFLILKKGTAYQGDGVVLSEAETNNKEPESTEVEGLDKNYDSFYDLEVQYKTCGSLDHIPNQLPQFTNAIYKTIKFLIPILLIVLGMKDFIQAVVSKDEKAMSEQKNKFIRRIAAAVIIFFIFSLIQFVISLAYNGDPESESVTQCMNCFLNDPNTCDTGTTHSGGGGSF